MNQLALKTTTTTTTAALAITQVTALSTRASHSLFVVGHVQCQQPRAQSRAAPPSLIVFYSLHSAVVVVVVVEPIYTHSKLIC